jgi:hypothetical protein
MHHCSAISRHAVMHEWRVRERKSNIGFQLNLRTDLELIWSKLGTISLMDTRIPARLTDHIILIKLGLWISAAFIFYG